MRRAVIFDVDGVLVDSYQPHFESWRRVMHENGLELSEEDFARTFGRTSREIIAKFWGDELDEERIREIDERKEALYRTIVEQSFPAMDGAVELIDALDVAGLLLAAGSSGPPPNVELTLDRLGRRDRFRAIVTGRDVTRGKPDPQVFQLAAERLGVEPGTCVVVEDAVAGIEAARGAGMAVVALAGTTTAGDLERAGATLVVRSLRELSAERIRAL